MADRVLSMRGRVAEDERELGGKRLLTIDAADAAETWLCTLHLAISADGALTEADLDLEGPAGAWATTLAGTREIDAEPFAVRAGFADPEGAAPPADIELEEDERAPGEFDLTLILRGDPHNDAGDGAHSDDKSDRADAGGD